MAVLPYDFGSATTPDRNFFAQLQADLEAIDAAMPVTPEQFGAVADGVTDDLAAINAAVAYAAANAVPEVFLSGSYRVSGTINLNNSNLTFRGGAVNKDFVAVSRIIADLAVTPVISVNGVFNVWIMDLQVTRAAGTPGSSTIGIFVNDFGYCGERNVLCDHHGYGRKLDNDGGGTTVSIQYDMDTPFSSHIVTADLFCNNVAQLKCRFGEFGRNGGEDFDRTQGMVRISANANDLLFVGCNFIPRGPTANAGFTINFDTLVFPTVGFFQFVNCNSENTNTCFNSNAATASVQDLHVIGGRWQCGGGLTSFNAATTTTKAIFSGVDMKGGELIDPEWAAITGCTIIDGFTLTGASSNANAQTDNTSVTVVGNMFVSGDLTLSASWQALTVTGNTVSQGTITDTSTVAADINKVVRDNSLQSGSAWETPTKTVRVTSQFDKTNTALADITGLTVDLVAGQTYAFRVVLFMTVANAGGSKLAMAGTATATNFKCHIDQWDDFNGTSMNKATVTALGSSAGNVPGGGSTTVWGSMEGLITVNAAGTFTAQFAQNAASGTSSVLVGSFMSVSKVP